MACWFFLEVLGHYFTCFGAVGILTAPGLGFGVQGSASSSRVPKWPRVCRYIITLAWIWRSILRMMYMDLLGMFSRKSAKKGKCASSFRSSDSQRPWAPMAARKKTGCRSRREAEWNCQNQVSHSQTSFQGYYIGIKERSCCFI